MRRVVGDYIVDLFGKEELDWYGNLGHKEVQDYVYTRVNQTTSL